MKTFDVAVVGAGLIGCSVAFELASEKLKVVVLDKQQPGREASWAAAGMLSPAPDSSEDIPLVPLARESLSLYGVFVRAIEEESQKTTGYARSGALRIFKEPRGESERNELIALHTRLGLAAEAISAETAGRREPSLSPAARTVAFFPDEGTIEPRSLMEAIVGAAAKRGVAFHTGHEVTSLVFDQDRCFGALADTKIAAKHVVLAAGCFSGALREQTDALRHCVPTRPVRGQLLALKREGLRLRSVLRSERGYLVPRADGRVIAGTTTEEAGFEKKVTAAGISQILSAGLELCPDLAGAEVVEAWSGLRPGTPDSLPILGPTEIEGLLVATGHYRNGILLAPITARLVREWIMGGQPEVDVGLFSPLRFNGDRQRTLKAPQ